MQIGRDQEGRKEKGCPWCGICYLWNVGFSGPGAQGSIWQKRQGLEPAWQRLAGIRSGLSEKPCQSCQHQVPCPGLPGMSRKTLPVWGVRGSHSRGWGQTGLSTNACGRRRDGLAMGTECQTGTELCRDSGCPGTPVAVGRVRDQHLLPTDPWDLKS